MSAEAPGSDPLAEPLLRFLSKVLNAPSLGFEEARTLMAGGAEAEIYALSLADPGGYTDSKADTTNLRSRVGTTTYHQTDSGS